MRYNPCGKAVAFLRHGYTAPCKFFKDSDVVGTIRWMLTDDRTPALGVPSKIMPLIWTDQPWVQEGVGEVYDGWRTYTRRKLPRTIKGDHRCGTDQDFREGGTYRPDLPPVLYDRDGFPLCCQPPFVGSGGGVGSGTATVTVTTPTCPAPSWVYFQVGAYTDSNGHATAALVDYFDGTPPGPLGIITPYIPALFTNVGATWDTGVWYLYWGFPTNWHAFGYVKLSCSTNAVTFQITVDTHGLFPPGTQITFTW